MSERVFRLVMGLWLLAALYAGVPAAVYALIAMLLIEGVTNLRVPMLVSRARGLPGVEDGQHTVAACGVRTAFEAERALRFIVAALLILTYVFNAGALWFFPWFIGFAMLGAGLSGVCPMVMTLRAMGLR